ncbi:MAG: hypothetical protein GX304_00315 [Clostridiales bacterium]|nr:hypothetical protein [Clostridiales bacterium]
MVKRWERIYLEEGEAGLSAERRGRSYNGKRKERQASLTKALISAILLISYSKLFYIKLKIHILENTQNTKHYLF